MITKICFRCKKEISNFEDFFSFNEFHDKKIIKVDYCHKECWDSLKKGMSNTDEAMGVVRGLKNKLVDMGMLDRMVNI